MELLSSIFLGCFIFGLVFTVASFLLGGLGHISGADGFGAGHGAHVHVGHGEIGHAGHGGHVGHGAEISHEIDGHHSASGHTHNDGGGLGWLNFSALIVFVTWFGGAGFVLSALGLPGLLALPLALVGGVIGYFAILLFFSKVLYPSQTPYMREQDYNLTGTVARVISSISENGTGEVVYTKSGTLRSVPARSLNGQVFSKEAQVVILRYENGVAFVEDLDKLLAEAGAEKWSTSSLKLQNGEVENGSK
jgi:membrane protein implicated in regulation of membrane protease activity